MHSLDRTNLGSPLCLTKFQYGTHTWDDLGYEDRVELRALLNEMQLFRCSYCEGVVGKGAHIEHFRRRDRGHFPHLTFEWTNLFYSCGSTSNCGHYKDSPKATPYDASDLVKPDMEDPDDFFFFHSSGEVRARPGLNGRDLIRANETIRVFNLNDVTLRAARQGALKQYERKEPNILDALIDEDEDFQRSFIIGELQATQGNPHWTVIRHFFEKVFK